MEWTKVTDGLPRKSRPVLVTLSEPDECIGAIEACFYDADNKEFGRVDINGDWYEFTWQVVAWMYGPRPYGYS